VLPVKGLRKLTGQRPTTQSPRSAAYAWSMNLTGKRDDQNRLLAGLTCFAYGQQNRLKNRPPLVTHCTPPGFNNIPLNALAGRHPLASGDTSPTPWAPPRRGSGGMEDGLLR